MYHFLYNYSDTLPSSKQFYMLHQNLYLVRSISDQPSSDSPAEMRWEQLPPIYRVSEGTDTTGRVSEGTDTSHRVSEGTDTSHTVSEGTAMNCRASEVTPTHQTGV